jgi:hypothetical protein
MPSAWAALQITASVATDKAAAAANREIPLARCKVNTVLSLIVERGVRATGFAVPEQARTLAQE